MSTHASRHIGRRIALLRIDRGWTQEDLARESGWNKRTLAAYEQGTRVPDSVSALTDLAVALGLADLTELTGGPISYDLTAAGRTIHPAIGELAPILRRPMLGVPQVDGTPPSAADVTRRAARAWETWHTSPMFYSDLAEVLPELIRDAELCARLAGHTPGEEETWREAQRAKAKAYHIARQWLRKVGEFALSDLAGDRALSASELADDPLLIAFSVWNLVGNHTAAGRYEAGEHAALDAIGFLATVPEPDDDLRAMSGALSLYASIAAARQGDKVRAWEHHATADSIARALGSGYFHGWTTFGQTNVTMYGVGIPVELGVGGDAVRAAESFDVRTMPCIERRTRYLLDLAQAYMLRGDDTAALAVFGQAEKESPEELAYSSYARDTVRVMLRRSRASDRKELVDLATRINVTV
jgi:transcriptional regulator with XRE-family HTH domain